MLVFVNLPFALEGGVLAVLLFGAGMSVGSLVGFVTLFGITLRNSIMMLSHYEHLVTDEGMHWGPETALRGHRNGLCSSSHRPLPPSLKLLHFLACLAAGFSGPTPKVGDGFCIKC